MTVSIHTLNCRGSCREKRWADSSPLIYLLSCDVSAQLSFYLTVFSCCCCNDTDLFLLHCTANLQPPPGPDLSVSVVWYSSGSFARVGGVVSRHTETNPLCRPLFIFLLLLHLLFQPWCDCWCINLLNVLELCFSFSRWKNTAVCLENQISAKWSSQVCCWTSCTFTAALHLIRTRASSEEKTVQYNQRGNFKSLHRRLSDFDWRFPLNLNCN